MYQSGAKMQLNAEQTLTFRKVNGVLSAHLDGAEMFSGVREIKEGLESVGWILSTDQLFITSLFGEVVDAEGPTGFAQGGLWG